MDRVSLCALSHDDLIAVILEQAEVIAPQTAQNAALTATIALLEKRVAELEEKLGKPPKTPNNSSLAPSASQKPNLPERERKGRKGRPGVNRALAADPDHVIEALAQQCPNCSAALGEGDQRKVHAYDHIDMPPIKPVTMRINLHSGVCPCCAATFTAPVPAGMEPGSPFGPGIQALVIHLHVTQAIRFERLGEMMKAIFGLEISEGAIANILQRALKPMLAAAEAIGEEVRCAEVIASDETSARVAGRKHWQWVMHTFARLGSRSVPRTRGAWGIVGFPDPAV